MKIRIRHGSPVIVRWFDANSDDETIIHANEEFDRKIEAENCGWYVSSDKKYVTLASEKYEDGHYRTIFNIPKVNIISIRRLS